MPPMNSTGMKTATSEIVMERIVKPISREPASAASQRPLAALHVADDVLEHDDRVVDDEADRERQREEREVVEAVAEQRHRRERADERERQREAGITVAETLRRNTKITITTSTTASSSVNFTSLTDSRIDSERSKRTSSLTDGGICARNGGSSALTSSTTSTVLASGLALDREHDRARSSR